MKITKIKKFAMRLESKKVGWSKDEYVWPSKLPSVIIIMETNEGISGVGEATSQLWYLGETLDHISRLIDIFSEKLVGKDPTNMEKVHHIMNRTVGGGAPSSRSAFAAIDIACMDIKGKVEGKPIYESLGGYRTELDLLTNLYQKTPEAMKRASQQYIKRGFHGLKIKVGDELLNEGWSKKTFEREIDKLLAALEVTPEEIYVDADANQGWRNTQITVNAIQTRLGNYSNLSIEQPLGYFNISGHSFVKNNVHCPLILDESVLSPEILLEIVKQEAADRIVIKLNRVGGIWPARRMAVIAESNDIGISVDTNPFTKIGDTASCHFAATLRDHYPVDAEGHLSFLKEIEPNFIHGGVNIKGGNATLPNKPGLGIEIDEDKLQNFAMDKVH
ncbi:mandelate racemase/muconate lactonizing enzyme family protein [Candidatus Bipolaricaulota bacterium]|nr:mandelate racemase/muconate lactonizing enzyme family protein [Candidatus Bipolaricaulota bacterium]